MTTHAIQYSALPIAFHSHEEGRSQSMNPSISLVDLNVHDIQSQQDLERILNGDPAQAILVAQNLLQQETHGSDSLCESAKQGLLTLLGRGNEQRFSSSIASVRESFLRLKNQVSSFGSEAGTREAARSLELSQARLALSRQIYEKLNSNPRSAAQAAQLLKQIEYAEGIASLESTFRGFVPVFFSRNIFEMATPLISVGSSIASSLGVWSVVSGGARNGLMLALVGSFANATFQSLVQIIHAEHAGQHQSAKEIFANLADSAVVGMACGALGYAMGLRQGGIAWAATAFCLDVGLDYTLSGVNVCHRFLGFQAEGFGNIFLGLLVGAIQEEFGDHYAHGAHRGTHFIDHHVQETLFKDLFPVSHSSPENREKNPIASPESRDNKFGMTYLEIPSVALASSQPPPAAESGQVHFSNTPSPGSSIDLSRYEKILEEGIKTEADLTLARELYRELDPLSEDIARLERASAAIPHEFEARGSVSSTGGVTLGKTYVTFSQEIDRQNAGVSEKISFCTDVNKEGVDLFTPAHEWTHGVAYKDLPDLYLQFSLPKISKEDPFTEIYSSVLSNRLWDEAFAFSTELLVARRFQEKTGRSLYSFKAQRSASRTHQDYQSAFDEKGVQGVYEWMQNNPVYLPYKIASLYIALLTKSGETDFPDWSTLISQMGFKVEGSRLILSEKSMSYFYEKYLVPHLSKHGFGTLSIGLGLSVVERKLLLDAFQFFMGKLNQSDSIVFLKKHFEGLIPLIAQLAFGEENKKQDYVHTFASAPGLPLRTTAMRIADPRDLTDSERSIDKVALSSSLVAFLYHLATHSDEATLERYPAFTLYAEQCDEETAAKIYSHFLKLYAEYPQHYLRKWIFGLSLIASGYEQEGREFCSKALETLYSKEEMQFGNLKETEIAFRHYVRKAGLQSHWSELLGEFFDKGMQFALAELPRINRIAEDQQMSLEDYMASCAEVRKFMQGEILFFQFLTQVSNPELHSFFSPAFLGKIRSYVLSLWQVAQKVQEGKIELYRQDYAAEVENFDSLEELTSKNLHWRASGTEGKEFLMDLCWLTGSGPKAYDSHDGASSILISNCLEHPLFYELGLELLSNYPNCFNQIHLYGIAVRHLPQDCPTETRRYLAEVYQTTLVKMEGGLRELGFTEDQRSERKAWEKRKSELEASDEVSFRDTEVFVEHQLNIAQVLLSSEDVKLKRQGLACLNALPSHLQVGISKWLQGDEYFPALQKSKWILEHVDSIPEAERERYLHEAFEILQGLHCNPINFVSRIFALLYLAKLCTCWSYRGLCFKALGVLKNLEEDFQVCRPFPAHWEEWQNKGFQRNWKKAKVNCTLSQELIPALWQGEASLRSLWARIRQDNESGRGLFDNRAMESALDFLGHPDLRGKVSRKLLYEFAELAINVQLRVVGSKERLDVRKVFSTLVKTLIALDLEDPDKDKLLSHLITILAPEKGLNPGEEAGGAAFHFSEDVLRLFEHVLGNPKTPQAEKLLLGHLADAAVRIKPNHSDPRVLGALYGLGWTFERVVHQGIVDPACSNDLKALSADAKYQAQVDLLQTFLNPPTATQVKGTLSAEKSAELKTLLEKGEVEEIRVRTDEIKVYLEEELRYLLNEKKSKNVGFYEKVKLYPEDYSNTVFFALMSRSYEAWRKRKKDKGEFGFLLSLWVESSDTDLAMAKLFHYYSWLDVKSIGLPYRRMIFQGLRKAGLVSHYAEHHLKQIEGNEKAESKFYSAFVPILNRRGEFPDSVSDYHLTLALGSPAYFEFYAYSSRRHFNKPREKINLDSRCPAQWETQAIRNGDWKKTMSNLYGAFLLCSRVPKETQVLSKELKRIYALPYLESRWEMGHGHLPRLIPKAVLTAVEKEWSDFKSELGVSGDLSDVFNELKNFSVIPSLSQARSALAIIPQMFNRRERVLDEIRMSTMELPEAFQSLDPLAQFFFSRFFALLPLGEQQILLKKMKSITREKALTTSIEEMGLEKCGQALGQWPECPLVLREELAHLQSDVKPSDFEEVKNAIRAQLPAALAEHYITQMQADLDAGKKILLGSGSIGETYKSTDPNGLEVAIKVIPISKERKFRRALENIRKVAKLLLVQQDKYPGAAQALRFAEMFLEIVESEFNLNLEAQNANEARKLIEELGLEVSIPKVLFSNKKLMIQEFVQGSKLTQVKEKSLRKAAVAKVNAFLQAQILNRQYHTDLQLGNILVGENGQVYILDFGQMAELSQEEFLLSWDFRQSLEQANIPVILQTLKRMSEEAPEVDWTFVHRDLSAYLARRKNNTSPIKDLKFILKLCSKYDLYLLRPYLKLLKAIFTFDATRRSSLKAA